MEQQQQQQQRGSVVNVDATSTTSTDKVLIPRYIDDKDHIDNFESHVFRDSAYSSLLANRDRRVLRESIDIKLEQKYLSLWAKLEKGVNTFLMIPYKSRDRVPKVSKSQKLKMMFYYKTHLKGGGKPLPGGGGKQTPAPVPVPVPKGGGGVWQTPAAVKKARLLISKGGNMSKEEHERVVKRTKHVLLLHKAKTILWQRRLLEKEDKRALKVYNNFLQSDTLLNDTMVIYTTLGYFVGKLIHNWLLYTEIKYKRAQQNLKQDLGVTSHKKIYDPEPVPTENGEIKYIYKNLEAFYKDNNLNAEGAYNDEGGANTRMKPLPEDQTFTDPSLEKALPEFIMDICYLAVCENLTTKLISRCPELRKQKEEDEEEPHFTEHFMDPNRRGTIRNRTDEVPKMTREAFIGIFNLLGKLPVEPVESQKLVTEMIQRKGYKIRGLSAKTGRQWSSIDDISRPGAAWDYVDVKMPTAWGARELYDTIYQKYMKRYWGDKDFNYLPLWYDSINGDASFMGNIAYILKLLVPLSRKAYESYQLNRMKSLYKMLRDACHVYNRSLTRRDKAISKGHWHVAGLYQNIVKNLTPILHMRKANEIIHLFKTRCKVEFEEVIGPRLILASVKVAYDVIGLKRTIDTKPLLRYVFPYSAEDILKNEYANVSDVFRHTTEHNAKFNSIWEEMMRINHVYYTGTISPDWCDFLKFANVNNSFNDALVHIWYKLLFYKEQAEKRIAYLIKIDRNPELEPRIIAQIKKEMGDNVDEVILLRRVMEEWKNAEAKEAQKEKERLKPTTLVELLLSDVPFFTELLESAHSKIKVTDEWMNKMEAETKRIFDVYTKTNNEDPLVYAHIKRFMTENNFANSFIGEKITKAKDATPQLLEAYRDMLSSSGSPATSSSGSASISKSSEFDNGNTEDANMSLETIVREDNPVAQTSGTIEAEDLMGRSYAELSTKKEDIFPESPKTPKTIPPSKAILAYKHSISPKKLARSISPKKLALNRSRGAAQLLDMRRMSEMRPMSGSTISRLVSMSQKSPKSSASTSTSSGSPKYDMLFASPKFAAPKEEPKPKPVASTSSAKSDDDEVIFVGEVSRILKK